MSAAFGQSLPALVRQAQQLLIERTGPQAVPPAVLWQAPGESDVDFDARMGRTRSKLPDRVLLLGVCGPRGVPAPEGVRWVELPQKLLPLVNPARRTRYRVAYGGRGSAKSWSFARALIMRALERPVRVLCARELQGSIQESVHRLLCDQVEQLGLEPWFEVQQTTILGPRGSEFIFSGVRTNATKIKSMEGIDIVWGEEAETFSDYSWGILIPTIRKDGSEIWATFNPDQADDPTYTRFVQSPPPGALVEFVTWKDNPWFPAEAAAEREYLARVDPAAHAWIWGGECRAATDAQIFRGKYVVEAFEPVLRPAVEEPQRLPDAPKAWDGPYFGADWGFAQDPTTLIKCWVHARTLYIEYEVYAIGCDIDRTPALFDLVPGANIHIIRADSARPETISYMQQHGYSRVTAVEKWTGSVEDGIAHVRQYERVVIHPRCTHTIEEFRLYSYKVDRLSGDVLPEVVDQHNHTIDALRYALMPLIRKPAGWGVFEYTRQEAEKAAKPNQPGAEKGKVTPLAQPAAVPVSASGALNGGLSVKTETW